MFSVSLLPPAIDDIQDAYDWYEEQLRGLGERFLESIQKALFDLKMYPFYAIRYSTVRCVPVSVFPFMIHFELDEVRSLIFVKAILHTKMNDKKWGKQ